MMVVVVVLMAMVNCTIYINVIDNLQTCFRVVQQLHSSFQGQMYTSYNDSLPKEFSSIHEASNDGVASPNWQIRVQATPTQEY